jgi:hypothetical protein
MSHGGPEVSLTSRSRGRAFGSGGTPSPNDMKD